MKIDLYTKSVLTVIAACLVYLCLGRPAMMQTAYAQKPEATRVILAGWADPAGYVYRFDPSNRANGSRRALALQSARSQQLVSARASFTTPKHSD